MISKQQAVNNIVTRTEFMKFFSHTVPDKRMSLLGMDMCKIVPISEFVRTEHLRAERICDEQDRFNEMLPIFKQESYGRVKL